MGRVEANAVLHQTIEVGHLNNRMTICAREKRYDLIRHNEQKIRQPSHGAFSTLWPCRALYLLRR